MVRLIVLLYCHLRLGGFLTKLFVHYSLLSCILDVCLPVVLYLIPVGILAFCICYVPMRVT